MQSYLDLLSSVLEKGTLKEDRTGTGTISHFGNQLRFDLTEGFPLVTTKKIHFKSAVHELLWFISGETNIQYLQENGVRIWNEWADEDGNLGPVYGHQWRHWSTYRKIDDSLFIEGREIDQLKQVIRDVKKNPESRRHLVTAWNPADIHEMRLPPCHYAYQFYVVDGRISCLCVMRSVDLFLGLPFNMVDYGLLLMMVGQICDLEPHELVFQLGDCHIYNNHIHQVKLQLTREPLPLPRVELNPEIKNIDKFRYEDIKLIDYKYHPHIAGKVAV